MPLEVINGRPEVTGYSPRRIPRRNLLPIPRALVSVETQQDAELNQKVRTLAANILESSASRRDVLKVSAAVTGAVMFGPRATEFIIQRLPIPEEYPIPFLKPTEKKRPIIADVNKEMPGDLNIAVIAHRAGNSRRGIESAAAAGFTHADLDISKDDEGVMYAYHGDIREISGLKLGIDVTTATFNISPLPLNEAFELAAKKGIGLSIEEKGKRGGMSLRNLLYISKLADKYGVPVIFFSSKIPRDVEFARRIMGKNVTCFESIATDRQLDDFIKKDIKGTKGFFAQPELIIRNSQKIQEHGLLAYAEEVQTDEQVETLFSRGVVGLQNDAGVLQRLLHAA